MGRAQAALVTLFLLQLAAGSMHGLLQVGQVEPRLPKVGLLSISQFNSPEARGDLAIPLRKLSDPQRDLGGPVPLIVALCTNPKGDRKVVVAVRRKLARTVSAMWMRKDSTEKVTRLLPRHMHVGVHPVKYRGATRVPVGRNVL